MRPVYVVFRENSSMAVNLNLVQHFSVKMDLEAEANPPSYKVQAWFESSTDEAEGHLDIKSGFKSRNEAISWVQSVLDNTGCLGPSVG